MLNVLPRVDNIQHDIGKMNQQLSQIFGESAEYIRVAIQSLAKIYGYSLQPLSADKHMGAITYQKRRGKSFLGR
jgi:hypothetical protein